MNYSIKIVSKANKENTKEINGTGKVQIHSGDKIQILSDGAGVFSVVGNKSNNTGNLIAVKKGNDLQIMLENGDIITLTNFYAYENSATIQVVDANGEEQTLLSSDTPVVEIADGSFIAYTQGEESALLLMSAENVSLNSALSSQFDMDAGSSIASSASAGLGNYGILVLGGVAAASGSSSAAAAGSSSAATSVTLTGKFVDAAVGGIDYYIGGVLQGQTAADGSFTYIAGDTITFKVGSVIVGDIASSEINADNTVMPQDLAGVARTDTANDAVTKIAQMLQTVDSDGDSSNGITIVKNADGDIVNTANAVLLDKDTALTISATTTDAQIQAATEDAGDAAFVSEEAAVAHLNASTNAVEGNVIAATFNGTAAQAQVVTNLVGKNTALTTTGAATASDLNGLFDTTKVEIVVNSTTTISGTSSEIAALLSNTVISGTNYAATMTGAASTIVELIAINAATDGTITLNALTIAENYTGSAADLELAFAG
ncbi:MAG: hypothetical protein ACKVH9_08545, partial [Rhodobacterales bacterium]